MRVCVVSHYMPPHQGGVERVASAVAHAYARAGHEVTWVATAPPAPAGRSDEHAIRHLRVAAWNGLERRLSIPYPLPGPSGLREVARAAREADVVHVHDCLYATSVAASLATHRARQRVLVTQHVGFVRFGVFANMAQLAAYRTIGAHVIRSAAHVAFVSPAVRSWFDRIGVRPRESSVVPNGVDTQAFRPTEGRTEARIALGLATPGPLALFVGRLVPKKRIREAVEATRLARVPLLVVGDGQERDALEGASHVRHIPNVAPERMPDVYRAADIFVLPSRGEGMPVALLEALASGLPSLVSADPAFDEVVNEGAAERASDGRSLATLIERFAADAGARAALGSAGRTWAVARAGQDASSQAYVALVERLAG